MALLIVLLAVFLAGYAAEFRRAWTFARGPGEFLRAPIMRAASVFIALLAAPWLIGNEPSLDGVWAGHHRSMALACVLVSAVISFTWYRFLTWLDVFEREQFRWELLVFLAAVSIAFLVPGMYHRVELLTGFQLNGEAWNDWWYCFLVIGGLEETAKLIPWLLLWGLTRAADEPYDLVLYASISALGFAFVENIHYLLTTELTSVMGRTLFASVAHMVFASMVAYAAAMARWKKRPLLPAVLLGLVVAAAAHGFYDFWLLSPHRPSIFTMIFFLLTVQAWVIMKNNLLNVSPWFNAHVRPASTMFRYRIVNGTLFIAVLAFSIVLLHKGSASAWEFLVGTSLPLSWVLLSIAMHFSRYAPVQGRIETLRPSFDPQALFIPRAKWKEDLTGMHVEVHPYGPHLLDGSRMARPALVGSGVLVRRITWRGADDHYLLQVDHPSEDPGGNWLVRPERPYDTLPGPRRMIAHIARTKAIVGPDVHELGYLDARAHGRTILTERPWTP